MHPLNIPYPTSHRQLTETSPPCLHCMWYSHCVLCLQCVQPLLTPPLPHPTPTGGFAQGQGMFTLEEHVVLDGDERTRGTMVTNGPGVYKIPGFSDIPREFNVSLLKGVPNKRAIYSSKVAPRPLVLLAGKEHV